MYKLAPAALVFSALFINGCNSDSEFIEVGNSNSGSNSDFIGIGNSDSEFVGVENPNSSLVNTFDGTWSNGCEYDQLFGTADIISFKISGSNANLTIETYEYDTCIGNPIDTHSTTYNLTSSGKIALSDCYYGEKINASIEYPVTINGVSFTQEQYEALPALERGSIEVISEYDLLCTNQARTVLYSGEVSSGVGLSDATRPTRANLSFGLNKIQ